MRKFIGDKKFYLMVLSIAIPIMIQNGITNFVALLDNIMIGRIGTEQMSGAAIVNQLIFVYNLCIFGGVAGAGIFTAQFFGQNNVEGVRQTVRFKLWTVIVLNIITISLLLIKGEALILLFLTGEGEVSSIEQTLQYGEQYLMIMLLGLPAFALVQVYAGTLRECGKTVLPMVAGLVSVGTNLVLNYILIYGKFGAPVLGVKGAAIATVIARYVECIIVVVVTHHQSKEYPFALGLYRTLLLPRDLTKKIFVKGLPLLVNETLWSLGMSALVQCYSIRSIDVVAAFNISNTIANVFNIVFIALGDAVAIIVGQYLGAGKMKEARDADNKLIAFSVMCCTGIAIIMFILAPLFPNLYNTSKDVKELATNLIRAFAVFLPQSAFMHATYFTIRSGGKTLITFLFDSVFVLVISVPLAFVLSRYTVLPMLVIFVCVQLADLIKCGIGFILVKKGVWMQNIVADA
ncbi:Multi antimicrobial extrusion protein (Na(+)/drug antiporter), MATE family of MDR efflux pump [Lachnospiraceae bacterium TWA4]|nr:Multi antimicrobial extrusion protein (Na(+)/drug antiporter), MATE family of MDR efflux pump [Lachnospiraceae bacterium TWA4]